MTSKLKKLCLAGTGVLLVGIIAAIAVDARKLSAKQKDLENAWNTVLIETGRREILVPNMFRIVQSATGKESLKKLQDLRQQITASSSKPNLESMDSKAVQEFIESQKKTQAVLGKLVTLADAIKVLQKHRDFQIFSAQLKSLNARVVSAQYKYNSSAQVLNAHLHSFCGSLSKIFVKARIVPEM